MIKQINQGGSDMRGERGKYLILACRLIRMKYTRHNEEASANGAQVRANTARERLKPAAGSASRTQAGRD